jgi:beta,beta-carotene 9',10'-dioxygenase
MTPQLPHLMCSRRNHARGFRPPTSGLLRFDLRDNQVRRWFEDGCYPGEPVFVPRPGGADRLEGVIVSVVLDGQNDRSFLLVLDAKSYEEIGRAFAPHVIPFGFHGEFKS